MKRKSYTAQDMFAALFGGWGIAPTPFTGRPDKRRNHRDQETLVCRVTLRDQIVKEFRVHHKNFPAKRREDLAVKALEAA